MFRLTIVYGNKASQDFTGSWGFATLIQTNYETLLFDTGWDGPLLLENLKKLKIEPAGRRVCFGESATVQYLQFLFVSERV